MQISNRARHIAATILATLATFAAGALLHHYAVAITTWLANDVLPLAALPRSMGTYYPGFSNPEEGFAYQLRNLGLLTAMLPVIWLSAKSICSTPTWNTLAERRPLNDAATATLLAGVAFCLYAYLAYPPYIFPTNARIHWVDIYFSWKDQWLYALPKLINPLFYEFPHILVGLYGAASSALFYMCLRHLHLSWPAAVLGGISYIFASNLLIFANIAEDINLSMTLSLLCAYTFLSGRWKLFGLSIFLAFLARPTNLLFPATLIIVHYFAQYEFSLLKSIRSPLHAFRQEPGLVHAIMIALLPALAWNGYLIAIDQHFFVGGESNVVDNISSQRSIKVDGFTIERFSGTVLLHQLWVFPIPVTLMALCSILFSIRKPITLSSSLSLAAIATVALNILLVEYLKMWYFNIRYITYFYPLLLLAGFSLLPRLHRSALVRVALLLLIAGSTLTTFNYAFRTQEAMSRNPLALAFTERHALRNAAEDCASIWADHGSSTERNALAFLLKMDKYSFKVVSTNPVDSMRVGDCLVSARKQDKLMPIHQGDHVSVYKLPANPATHKDRPASD